MIPVDLVVRLPAEIARLRDATGHFGVARCCVGLSTVCEGGHRIQGVLARARHSDLCLVLVRFQVKLIIRNRNQFVAHAEKAPNRDNTYDGKR